MRSPQQAAAAVAAAAVAVVPAAAAADKGFYDLPLQPCSSGGVGVVSER